jgi:CheY-like chemotaxis protein
LGILQSIQCAGCAPCCCIAYKLNHILSPFIYVPKLIYLIEDDSISATITEMALRRTFGHVQVQTHENGQRAFDGLASSLQTGSQLPDLILLDLNMPVMDGWEFLDAFTGLALPQPISVFVLTSSIHSEELARFAHYPAVKSYFSKPLDMVNLARMQRLVREVEA